MIARTDTSGAAVRLLDSDGPRAEARPCDNHEHYLYFDYLHNDDNGDDGKRANS